MAASDGVHPVQFKLFMSGQEWQDTVTDSVDRQFVPGKNMKSLWAKKLKEAKVPPGGPNSHAHGAGIHQSLSEQGYQHDAEFDPPTIYVRRDNTLVQGEGHHRIAAAADIEKTTGKHVWIPTNYEG